MGLGSKSSKGNFKKALDLGIGDLIGDLSSLDESPEVNIPSSISKSQVDEAQIPEKLEARSEYEELAEANEWPNLVRLTEKRLTNLTHQNGPNKDYQSTTEYIEARLWWVEAHIKQGSVPPSILVAPLESVSETIKCKADFPQPLKLLAARILAMLGDLLNQKNNPSDALTLLEHASALDPRKTIILHQVAKSQLERLEEEPAWKRDKTFEERKAYLRKLLGYSEIAISAGTTEPTKSSDVNFVLLSTGELAKRTQQKLGQLRRGFMLISGSCAAVLILLIWNFEALIQLVRGPVAQVATENLAGNFNSPPKALLTPEITRTQGLGQLDAVLYDLGAKTNQKNNDATGLPKTEISSVSVSNANVPRSRPVNPSQKIDLDLGGPIEPVHVKQARQNPESVKASLDLGPSSNDHLFQKIPLNDRAAKTGTPSEKFNFTRVYKVIAPTTVVGSPSYRSSVVADLRPGDRIRVDAKEGAWLKLRSSTGQTGYILAQDAESDGLAPRK